MAASKNNGAKKYQILLVEDYPTNRKVAPTTCHQRDYAIDEAEDGEQAVALVKETKYDQVFMDTQMPVMDGYKATARIK